MTGDVLAKLLSTFRTDSLRNVRDRAILMVAFASGGRRRSEIAGLRKEQLTVEPPIPLDGNSGRLGPFRTTLSEVMCTIYLYAQCSGGINAVKANSEVPMPQTSYKISEARKKFAEVLERANQGEEIVIMRGNEVYVPQPAAESVLLACCATVACQVTSLIPQMPSRPRSTLAIGMTIPASGRANPTATKARNESPARQPCRLLVDDRQ